MSAAPIDIRPVSSGDLPAFNRCLGVGFGEIAPPDHVSTWTPLLDPERCLTAFDGDEMVGGAAAIALGITVPGTIVQSGAVVGAAVLPTHRRRGLLANMMVRHLRDMHDRGEVLSTLWVSEWPIYGRFGYGVATLSARYEVDPAHAAFTPPPGPAGRMRMVDAETALSVMSGVYDRVRGTRVGFPERPPLWWHHLFSDSDHRRQGLSPLQFVVHSPEGGPAEAGPAEAGAADGYLAYRIGEGMDADGLTNAEVTVLELMAAAPGAAAALWRLCLTLDSVSVVRAENRPVDDPLVHLLLDGRRLRRRINDGMWIRLVDVAGALCQRRYRTAGALTVRVHDAVCPWNEATFRLEVDPSGACCEPSGAEPDLELGVADLAGAYLGTSSLHPMADAGKVSELRAGALDLADVLFAWSPAPWCPNVF